ncbi:uncharacterized protein LOC109535149 [Dendroctonus ponderosae]|uniref:uncharacterized protein LOC109535149 n=1 Tax=Dendroctonus ponderosae TaxID=77166 RepID=UPI0020360E38|nr:uncharacterized protein LOC109535149 [Dendroctonus ponderosae]KAH1017531.1 hypothetical protein HUJ05_008155 [Dendroctonus ponderosae]
MSPVDILEAEADFADNALLRQALVVTEVAFDLKERYTTGEKYINYLKVLINGAEKGVDALAVTARSSFNVALKLLQSNICKEKISDQMKHEYNNLQAIIIRELNAFDLRVEEMEADFDLLNLDQLAEKIRSMDTKTPISENVLQPNPSSNRSSKMDINEKYPENISRESLIDLNNVINLPPVPEDIFTSFSNKPVRTSSLSSLKSMRKVKLSLQKAENSDDEDSSDTDEHDYSRMIYGDIDEAKLITSHSASSKKLQLGNIKEESQD